MEKGASQDDIKKAFRKLAHKYHPDKKGGDETRFKEIGEAYAVLGNVKKRAEYDTYGQTFNGGGPQGGGFGGFDFGGFQQGFGGQGVEFDLGDLFGDFFGGGRGRQQRGRDISIDIELDFKESIFGVEREVLLGKVGTCKTCGGTGAKPGTELVTCELCNGAGKIHETKQTMLGAFATTRICDRCHGKGKMPKAQCDDCLGQGVRKQEEEIKIAVPAGIENGEMIRMTGGGEAIAGGVPGDLYVKVHVQDDKRFKKEGHNLVMSLSIKLTDALLGGSYDIETLDGELKLKIPQGVTHGERLRVKGKGVPKRTGSRGDLFVQVDIMVPAKLSRAAKKAAQTLRDEGV